MANEVVFRHKEYKVLKTTVKVTRNDSGKPKLGIFIVDFSRTQYRKSDNSRVKGCNSGYPFYILEMSMIYMSIDSKKSLENCLQTISFSNYTTDKFNSIRCTYLRDFLRLSGNITIFIEWI